MIVFLGMVCCILVGCKFFYKVLCIYGVDIVMYIYMYMVDKDVYSFVCIVDDCSSYCRVLNKVGRDGYRCFDRYVYRIVYDCILYCMVNGGVYFDIDCKNLLSIYL